MGELKKYGFIFNIVCVQKTEARTCSTFPGLQSNFKQLVTFNGFTIKGIERKERRKEREKNRKEEERKREGKKEQRAGNVTQCLSIYQACTRLSVTVKII